MKKQFVPDDFLWGASTSAFQVEGAALTNGKGLSVADERTFVKQHNQMDTKVSVDEYHHLEEDVNLMAEMGIKAYRFSISWTRIFPTGTKESLNQEGVTYYHKLLDLLKKNNITPVVTMFHFDYPSALVKKYGGWTSRQAIDDFVVYAKFLLREYQSQVKYWLTINEQNVMVNQPELLGITGNSEKEIQQKAQTANLFMCLAQAKVFQFVKQTYPDIKISAAVSYITALPATGNSSDVLFAKQVEDYVSFYLMDIVVKGSIPVTFLNHLKDQGLSLPLEQGDLGTLRSGTANFLAVNWYCTTTFAKSANPQKTISLLAQAEVEKNPNLQYTDWGWSLDSVGLRYAMQQVNDRYPGVEVMITECGWSEKEQVENGRVHDPMRIKYFHDHIQQLELSVQDGVNIIGFCPWSFIDLLSVNDGMDKRYGFVFVDRTNFDEKELKRIKKDSFYYYQQVIAHNGDLSLVKKEANKWQF